MIKQGVCCARCKADIAEITARGSYLRRINAKGVPGIFVCADGCCT